MGTDLVHFLFFLKGLALAWRFRFPDFPHSADQIRTGFQSHPTRLPLGGTGFRTLGGPNVLEGMDLPQGLRDISSDRRCQDLHGLNDAVRIDDESAPDIDSSLLIVDTVRAPQVPTGIGQEREGDAALDHFGEFGLMPDLVHEYGVDGTGENVDSKLGEFAVRSGDRRYFGRSDEGKIAWVKAQQDPLAQRIR